MITDTLALSTAWTSQPARGKRSARTLLVGAATFTCRHRSGSFEFDLATHSISDTDDPASTMMWLSDQLRRPPARLLLWRGEDIVVPSVIAACETASDTGAAVKLLQELDAALDGEIIDVAEPHGGSAATSFDAVNHDAGLPFRPMSRAMLNHAHQTGCHEAIRKHLASRAVGTWRLWLASREDAAALTAATNAWVATPINAVRL